MSSSHVALHKLDELIADPSVQVGTLVSMNYTTALLASNDFYIAKAKGMAQRTFLLAEPLRDEDDKLNELVLLSITDVAPLDAVRAFQHVREDLALSGKDAVDTTTKANLQHIGFTCQIMGTFYYDEEGTIKFGADVERILGHTLYKVYKPRGVNLSHVASHSNENYDPQAALSVGVVRYSDTQRHKNDEARVFVNVEDFLGTKTFMGGITRTGKSSSIKTILQKVFQYTHSPGKTPVGQLIFDPQGEYANTNSQDGTALAAIGNDDEIRIYKMFSGEKKSPKEQHLQFNLFSDENIQLAWELMTGELRSGISSEANYIQPLYELDFYKPDKDTAPKEAWGSFSRKKLAYYALLSKIKWNSQVDEFGLYIGRNLADKAVHQLDEVHAGDKPESVLINSTQGALALFDWIKDKQNELPAWWIEDFKEGTLGTIAKQFDEMDEGRNGLIGAFWKIKGLHNIHAQGDVRNKIWRDMEKGRLVVVDLSKGSNRANVILSELIVKHLLSESSARFTTGEAPLPYQIVVEEAHNLFDASKGDEDPWVRISKEAAKYNIGLMYATQEVTSVDPRILSNTVNWIQGHYNSRTETKELGRYYSFGDWEAHLLKVEAKGFVRMKMKSSPYVIPVQFDKFEVKAEESSSKPKLTIVKDSSEEPPPIDDLSELF